MLSCLAHLMGISKPGVRIDLRVIRVNNICNRLYTVMENKCHTIVRCNRGKRDIPVRRPLRQSYIQLGKIQAAAAIRRPDTCPGWDCRISNRVRRISGSPVVHPAPTQGQQQSTDSGNHRRRQRRTLQPAFLASVPRQRAGKQRTEKQRNLRWLQLPAKLRSPELAPTPWWSPPRPVERRAWRF